MGREFLIYSFLGVVGPMVAPSARGWARRVEHAHAHAGTSWGQMGPHGAPCVPGQWATVYKRRRPLENDSKDQGAPGI